MLLLNDIEKHFWQIIDQPDLRPELIIKKFLQLSKLVGIPCDGEEVLKELKALSFELEHSNKQDIVLHTAQFLFNDKKFLIDHDEDIRGLFIERVLKDKQGHPLCLALIFQVLCHWQNHCVDIIEINSRLFIKTTHNEQGRDFYLDLTQPEKYLNNDEFLAHLNQARKNGQEPEALEFNKIFNRALDIFENHFENKKLFKLLLLTLEIKTQRQPSDIKSLQKKIRLNSNFSRTQEVEKDLKKLSFISDFKVWPLDLQEIYLNLQSSKNH